MLRKILGFDEEKEDYICDACKIPLPPTKEELHDEHMMHIPYELYVAQKEAEFLKGLKAGLEFKKKKKSKK